MIIIHMSDILKFQIIFTLTSEWYVCNLSIYEKRKPEKLCPTFQATFMVCSTLDKQNSMTFQGKITVFKD